MYKNSLKQIFIYLMYIISPRLAHVQPLLSNHSIQIGIILQLTFGSQNHCWWYLEKLVEEFSKFHAFFSLKLFRRGCEESFLNSRVVRVSETVFKSFFVKHSVSRCRKSTLSVYPDSYFPIFFLFSCVFNFFFFSYVQ